MRAGHRFDEAAAVKDTSAWPIEKRRLNPIPASTHRLQALT
jgi:hypothetical protein